MRLLPKDQDWTPYGYLIYLVYYIVVPFLVPVPVWYRILTVAVTLAALALYFTGYWLRDRRILWIVAAFVALGAGFLPSNVAASVFFVYGAAYLGKVFKPAEAWRYLSAILAIIGLETVLVRPSVYAWVPAVLFTLLIGATVIQQYSRKRLTECLLLAQDEAQQMAKIAERERIGRDLHDLLGHTLSVIVLKSELASKLMAADPTRAAAEIQDVERIGREALSQVRSAVQGYRSGGIDREIAAARSALASAGVRIEASLDPSRLSPSLEGVLALALREAVTNVVRHAGATACRLTLRRDAGWCELEVADNGRGGPLQEGSGLSGMRQRVEALGGILERDNSAGMRLRIRVPV
jgi:two-component system, NarL family, sensor histidine kinase DesK